MNRERALTQLAEILRGRIPPRANWPEMLWLAGEELIVPELCARLRSSDALEAAPEDVRGYLAEARRRNRERNASLFATLSDVLAALNAASIEPVLLKGCATWARPGRAVAEPEGDRMVADLDLLVRPGEMQAALDALIGSGFAVVDDCRAHPRHPVVDLARRGDVGMIDLHQRAPGPVGVAEVDDVHAHCAAVEIGGMRARLPSPELQIVITMLHDQLRDGNFWHGGFSLRHLLDVALLASLGVDWSALRSICGAPRVRHALGSHLLAAKRIAGADIPEEILGGFWSQAHYARQRLQFTQPALNAAFRALGLDHRAWRVLSSRRIGGPGAAASAR